MLKIFVYLARAVHLYAAPADLHDDSLRANQFAQVHLPRPTRWIV